MLGNSLCPCCWNIEAPYPRTRVAPTTPQRVFLTIDFTTAVVDEALNDPSVGVIIAYRTFTTHIQKKRRDTILNNSGSIDLKS